MGHARSINDTLFTTALSDTQEDLLMAALKSNNPTSALKRGSDGTIDTSVFTSPQQLGGMDSLDYHKTPYLDYLDDDGSFDMDGQALDGQQMIGAMPGDLSESFVGGERHDKRKMSDYDDEEGDEDEEGDFKRREGEDKTSKKPGRKPLTNEPTTKRKAQNRAAQRAFRERKEQHLKDLETKVNELTKTSEKEKQENGLLKAQVQRLRNELVDYKKRLSSDAARNSPPTKASTTGNSASARNSFSFDFPIFGSTSRSPQSFASNAFAPPQDPLVNYTSAVSGNSPVQSRSNSGLPNLSPGSQRLLGQQSATSRSSGTSDRQAASSQRQSTGNSINASPATSQLPNSGLDSFAGLFSPNILNGAGFGTEDNDYGFPASFVPTTTQIKSEPETGTDSNSGISRVFRFNSASISSNNDSPSASSQSQTYGHSSCDTSPEPYPASPAMPMGQRDAAQNTKKDFSLNNVGNINSLNTDMPSTAAGFDWLASQNGGQFDPVLFGDYRESQDAIVGDGEFNNGFFSDAFPIDFGSPLNFDDLTKTAVPQGAVPTSFSQEMQGLGQPQTQQQQVQIPASRNLLAEVERQRDGGDDYYGLPNMAPSAIAPPQKKMLNCNTIWNQLQSNKDFQEGKFDLDSLCSELRTKAKCSENGVVIPEDHVAKAFQNLSGDKPSFVFEQEQVDMAMKKAMGARGRPA